jgi:hypothetical protein
MILCRVEFFRRRKNGMPDQSEILLQEIAILRREVANVRGALENLDQLIRGLNVTLVKCVDQLAGLSRSMESRLPPISQ